MPFLLLASVIVVALAVPCQAQSGAVPVERPHLKGTRFQEFAVPRPDGSEAHYFVRRATKSGKRPLVLYCEGSGCNSLFAVRDGKLRFGMFAVLAERAGDAVDMVAVEKRGVPFGYRGHGGAGIDAPATYTENATWEQRVQDNLLALEAVLKDESLGPVLVAGHSEGADIAAGVAAATPRVTHLALLAGGAPTQMFDFMILERRRLHAEKKTPAEVEAEIVRLEDTFRAIQADPHSTVKSWQGHAYRRWSSYFAHPALDNILSCRARLYVVQGTEDTAVPVESADLLACELIRVGRKDVVFRRIPGAGHRLEVAPGTSLETLMSDIMQWFRGVPHAEDRRGNPTPARP